MTDRWGHSGTWEETLRQTFKGADIKVEDLFLLEACDLESLHERITPRALAAVLHANPSLKRVWSTRYPEIWAFIDNVTAKCGPPSTRE